MGEFDLRGTAFGHNTLIIGVDSSLPLVRIEEIELKLSKIYGIGKVVVVPGLKGAYCIKA